MGGTTPCDRLSEAIVDLGAVAHNVRLFKGRTSAALMAVVKADGFGHGAVPVARTALANGVGWLRASQYPKIWQAAGLPYPRLLDLLIETAPVKART